MNALLQDIRYGLRMLAKTPGRTAIIILTLALGIGANTAVFSMADAFLVHPVSLPHLDRLAVVAAFQKAPVSASDFLDLRAQAHSFASLSAYRQDDLNLTGGSAPQRVYGSRVFPNFFSTLEVAPELGRTFSENEGEPGHDSVAILSHGVWEQRFAGRPDVIGQTIQLDGRSYAICGVMPRDFDFPVPSDVWIPLAPTPAERADRSSRNLQVIGRLENGVSLTQAQSEISAIGQRLARAYPGTDKDLTVHVMSVPEYIQGTITRSYTFLFLICVGIVLLVACSNIAGLELARSTARQKEISIRAALGASRWRIARLFLVENVLLGILGGAVSLILASGALNLMDSNMPADIARLIPGWYEIRLDNRALLFTLAVAILAGILGGLLPALSASKASPGESLKEGGAAGIGHSRQRLRSTFIVAQIVVALVLVVSAALMVKGFGHLVQTQESYAPEHVLTLAVNLPASRYATPAQRELFYHQALARLAATPGVRDAETFYTIPLSNNGTDWRLFQIEGRTFNTNRHAERRESAILQTISPGYFPMMRIALRQGRVFTPADEAGTQPVAIVSETFANSYWPGKSAIGRHIKIGGVDSKEPWRTVVGVASNVLYDWTNQIPWPAIYVPYMQMPPVETLLAIRTNSEAAGFAKSAQAAVASVDPQLPVFSVMPLSSAIHESIVGLAYTADMMATLGVIALVVALIGVYGVMAYAVAERTHEFGVRMALGAQPSDVLSLVSRRGAWLAGAGLIVGVPSAISVARLLAGLIYGTSAMDWSVFAGIAVLLAAVIAAACYIPARRAMRVDPIVALRYE